MNDAFKGKVALITGGSRGLGFAVAKALAEQGAELILVARDKKNLEKADDSLRALNGGKASTLVPMELADGAGIDRLGGAIFERWGKLDILVGNGGILGGLSPIAHIDPSTWQKTLDANLTANWRLMRSMELLLRKSACGRAVFVSSSAVRSLRSFWGAYAVSKAGLDALVQIWAKECADSDVKINLFEPGAIRTQMRAQAMPGEDPLTLPTPEEVAPHLLALLSEDFSATGQKIIYQS